MKATTRKIAKTISAALIALCIMALGTSAAMSNYRIILASSLLLLINVGLLIRDHYMKEEA
ncbi:MAG: hypothetical protein J6U23_13010 [Clostridiales bacterium]|nr:hypothetical protein [Clostridiales bacterium]MBP5763010.1 hypothetical protein [Lachnospiraceae bacterium]